MNSRIIARTFGTCSLLNPLQQRVPLNQWTFLAGLTTQRTRIRFLLRRHSILSFIHVLQHKNKVIVFIERDAEGIPVSSTGSSPTKNERKTRKRTNECDIFTKIRRMIQFGTPVAWTHQMKCAQSAWLKTLGKVCPLKLHNMVFDRG